MKRRMKLTPARLYGKFMGFMVGITDKNAQDTIENQQKALDYCMEENKVYKEIILELTGKKRVPVRDTHRRRLAVKAIALNIHILTSIVTIFQPATLLRWHRDLVRKKYSKRSTPEHYRTITPEIVNEVLLIAKNNQNWGYQRIRNMMKYLGFEISRMVHLFIAGRFDRKKLTIRDFCGNVSCRSVL